MTNINQKLRKTEPNTISKWLWQVTLPLSVVVIVALTCLTMIYMTNGQYLFDAEITKDKIKIQTQMEKDRDHNP